MIAAWRSLIALVQQLASFRPTLTSTDPAILVNKTLDVLADLEGVEASRGDWETLVIKKKVSRGLGAACTVAGGSWQPDCGPNKGVLNESAANAQVQHLSHSSCTCTAHMQLASSDGGKGVSGEQESKDVANSSGKAWVLSVADRQHMRGAAEVQLMLPLLP